MIAHIAHTVLELLSQQQPSPAPPPLPLPTVPGGTGPIQFPTPAPPAPAVPPVPTDIVPNVTPTPPDGANQILKVLGNFKWGAGIALAFTFFGGLIAWTAGRVVDHHRFGRVGVIMMLCAVGGGILYAVVPTLIETFATGG